MNFNQLLYFSEIVKCKSFNAAAKSCFITYPAISKNMKNLEEELGFDLFIRSNRGITLTPKGEIFYADVCKILDIKASWQALAADHAKSLRTVHIVTSTANYCLIIKPLLAMLQHLESDIDVVFSVVSIHDIVHKIEKNSDLIILDSEYNAQSINHVLAESCGLQVDSLYHDRNNAAFLSLDNPLAKHEKLSRNDLHNQTINVMADPTSSIVADYLELFSPAKTCKIWGIEDSLQTILQENSIAIMAEKLERYIADSSYREKITKRIIIDYQCPLENYIIYPANPSKEQIEVVALIKNLCDSF